MARKRGAVSIGDVVPEVLRQAHGTREALQTLQRQWRQVAGKQLAGHTKPVSVRRGALYVRADEPGASFALSLETPALLRALNAAGVAVEEIVVVAGEVSSS